MIMTYLSRVINNRHRKYSEGYQMILLSSFILTAAMNFTNYCICRSEYKDFGSIYQYNNTIVINQTLQPHSPIHSTIP